MPRDEEQLREFIIDTLSAHLKTDRYAFDKLVQMLDGRNIQTGKTTGTKIGTETTQKLGFFNATPVVQQNKINDPSGGGTTDAEARSAINSIIDALEALGFTASS